MADLDPRPDSREMLAALARVHALDPAGVGARDIPECLKLQLRRQPPSRERDLAIRILTHEFKALVHRDLQRIAQRVQSTPAEIERICACIRRLDPRPGARFSEEVASAVTPDVIVRKIRGIWTATLNPVVVPRVSLNRTYAELFQRHRESHHGDLATHLREARWTVQNLEQRFSTILRVAQALVERQQNFFEFGTLAMQPLGLKDIAEELGLHESTVSRATCNKYMVTPCGVFELKYFFSRALSTNQGSQCSTTAIREAIRKMIRSEDARAPHSDADITRLLMQQGLQVARRTVTKYRQMMNIPTVDMRRYHG
jgi:RNA polymerase sigma-54 factor